MKCELIGQEHHGSGGDVSRNLRRVRNESKSSKNKKRRGCINNQREEGKKWQHMLFWGTETGFKVQMITGTLKEKQQQQHKTQFKSGRTVITACIMYKRSSHLCVWNCGTTPSTRLVPASLSSALICITKKRERLFHFFFFPTGKILIRPYLSETCNPPREARLGSHSAAVLRASALCRLSLCSQRPERASSPFSWERR